MQRVGLCMIVKNEEAVLARCLRSLRGLIQHWTIVDTGSDDLTEEVARTELAPLPGHFIKRPWVDFGHNRSEALTLSRPHCDYSLVIDADDELRASPGFQWPRLQLPAYDLQVHDDGHLYTRAHLLCSRFPWFYRGVVHEHADCDTPYRRGFLADPIYWRHPNAGARSRDPEKFKKDAQLLARALKKEPHNPRTAYYLAQSYRDAGMLPEAARAFEQRAAMGGWVEERYNALLEQGRALARLQTQPDKVRSVWLEAYNLLPSRAEALCDLARFHRQRQQWPLALLFAERAHHTPMPDQGLFINQASHTWRPTGEYALALARSGRLAESATLWKRLLDSSELPDSERPAMQNNLEVTLASLLSGTLPPA